jgi:hypothetical protein
MDIAEMKNKNKIRKRKKIEVKQYTPLPLRGAGVK